MNQPARWEVIAWDGCGEWFNYAWNSRGDARYWKNLTKSVKRVVTDGKSREVLSSQRDYIAVKIYDRKNKRWVT